MHMYEYLKLLYVNLIYIPSWHANEFLSIFVSNQMSVWLRRECFDYANKIHTHFKILLMFI